MSELRDSTDLVDGGDALVERLRADSYLYFRGLLQRDEVLAVRERIVETLTDSGWLDPDHSPGDAVAGPGARPEVDGDPPYFEWYARLQALQPFHELAHAASLVDVVGSVLDDDVLVHPRKIARAALPTSETAVPTPPHQDFRLIQGATDTLTAWVPFGDYSEDHGGLRVLRGSIALGLRGLRAAPGVGGVTVDGDMESAGEWQTAEFRAGDVLVFHSLTVHGALPNRTARLRLSADYRYQRLSDPVTPDSLRPHYPNYIPGYDVLTQGWTSTTSVDVPEGVVLATMGDVFDPELRVTPSVLVER